MSLCSPLLIEWQAHSYIAALLLLYTATGTESYLVIGKLMQLLYCFLPQFGLKISNCYRSIDYDSLHLEQYSGEQPPPIR